MTLQNSAQQLDFHAALTAPEFAATPADIAELFTSMTRPGDPGTDLALFEFPDLETENRAEKIRRERRIKRQTNAFKCGNMRVWTRGSREISLLKQELAGGVKPPLSCAYRGFDTPGAQSAPPCPFAAAADLGAVLIISYDTEYQDLGDGTNLILSYQIVALDPEGGRVEFVVHVFDGDRLAFGEIVDVSRIMLGLTPGDLAKGEILIISHFGAAEWASLLDRDEMSKIMQLIRKVPVTLGAENVRFVFGKRKFDLKVRIIDTFLLAPDGSKSLAKLGEVVGIPKIDLPKGAIENMSRLRDDDRALFELYGIQDSRIALEYVLMMMDVAKRELGLEKLPLTTGGLSVKSFVQSLGQERYFQMFGLEKRKVFKGVETVPVAAREHVESFFAGGFAGGLNNASPSKVTPADNRVVFDVDFVSAYPAAMATVPVIDWSGLGTNGVEYGIVPTSCGGSAVPVSLTFVRFSFPETCRRPCIPVDAGVRGIVYPLEGEGYATGPEIAMARGKGAKLEITHKQAMPYVVDPDGRAHLAFAPFLGEMIERRRSFPPKSLENLLYKLICNSLYGKLAQGVKRRSIRSFASKSALPDSQVTCPAYAAAVTGAVRAALIALQDAVEEVGGVVHSATTDGCCVSFPGSPETHPDLESIPGLLDAVMRKPAVKLMAQGLINMGLDGDPLEVKSVGDGCEIWKTRGYVITRGDKVLHAGRAGHQMRDIELAKAASSAEIDRWEMNSLASAQSIFDGKNADLVRITQSRKVNLDFDFKMLPDGFGGFRPPKNVAEFSDWRDSADAIRKGGARATEERVALSVVGVQLRGGETVAVRRQLLRAALQGVGGLRPNGMSDAQVAEMFGFTKTDAKNAKRRPFQPLPRTPGVVRIIEAVLRDAGISGVDTRALTSGGVE